MTIARETHLYMSLPSNDDEDHGAERRQDTQVVGRVLSPDECYFVSPGYASADLINTSASDQRHFDLIQDAIDAATASDTIFIYPGSYNEQLSFTKHINLVGVGSWRPFGTTGAVIRGDGSADSVLEVAPPEGSYVRVSFNNLFFTNGYDTTNGTEITDSYLLNVATQTTPATYHSIIAFYDCGIRMQTWGEDNIWTKGMTVDGHSRLYLKRCDVSTLGYAGGNDNGGIRHLFYITGDGSDSAGIYLDDVRVQQEFLASGDTFTFSLGAPCYGTIFQSTFNYDFPAPLIDIISGAPVVNGLTESAYGFDIYNNKAGLDVVWF